MATHRSAEKRARQAKKRAARNQSVDSRVKSMVRGFREALAEGDAKKAEAALGVATRELRKAASKGVLHKRNASRRVSRLVLAFNGGQSAK
jgi:small subunit ribosomal protein S20